MSTQNAPLVWIDCEMTGLDPATEALVEVAVLITDSELNVLDDGMEVVIKPDPDIVAKMDPFVVNMHQESGLLAELESGTDMATATRQVLDYITARVPEAGVALLAGNSVGQDKLFLSRDMPAVIEHLHYRIVDVSTVKELVRRWYPSVYENVPEKTGNHRALGDISDSIAELAHYREHAFK